jgi:hypothetical protein
MGLTRDATNSTRVDNDSVIELLNSLRGSGVNCALRQFSQLWSVALSSSSQRKELRAYFVA